MHLLDALLENRALRKLAFYSGGAFCINWLLYALSSLFTTGWFSAINAPWLKKELLLPFERNTENFWVMAGGVLKSCFSFVFYFWQGRDAGLLAWAFSVVATLVTLTVFLWFLGYVSHWLAKMAENYTALPAAALRHGTGKAQDHEVQIVSAAERKLVALANTVRAKHGLPPAVATPALAAPPSRAMTVQTSVTAPVVSMPEALALFKLEPSMATAYGEQDVRRIYEHMLSQWGADSPRIESAWTAVCRQRGWALRKN